MLALAHYIERQVEDNAIPDYAAAARALGLTRARITQITGLLLLAPEIQERVLDGGGEGDYGARTNSRPAVPKTSCGYLLIRTHRLTTRERTP